MVSAGVLPHPPTHHTRTRAFGSVHAVRRNNGAKERIPGGRRRPPPERKRRCQRLLQPVDRGGSIRLLTAEGLTNRHQYPQYGAWKAHSRAQLGTRAPCWQSSGVPRAVRVQDRTACVPHQGGRGFRWSRGSFLGDGGRVSPTLRSSDYAAQEAHRVHRIAAVLPPADPGAWRRSSPSIR